MLEQTSNETLTSLGVDAGCAVYTSITGHEMVPPVPAVPASVAKALAPPSLSVAHVAVQAVLPLPAAPARHLPQLSSLSPLPALPSLPAAHASNGRPVDEHVLEPFLVPSDSPQGPHATSSTASTDGMVDLSIQLSDDLPSPLHSHELHMLIAVHTPKAPPTERAPMDVVAVIDTSGSMDGAKLDAVRESWSFLVRHGLQEGDRLGLVRPPPLAFLRPLISPSSMEANACLGGCMHTSLPVLASLLLPPPPLLLLRSHDEGITVSRAYAVRALSSACR